MSILCVYIGVCICLYVGVMNPPGSLWSLWTSLLNHWRPDAPGNEMHPKRAPGNTTGTNIFFFFAPLHFSIKTNYRLLFHLITIKDQIMQMQILVIKAVALNERASFLISFQRYDLLLGRSCLIPHPSPCNHSQLRFLPIPCLNN